MKTLAHCWLNRWGCSNVTLPLNMQTCQAKGPSSGRRAQLQLTLGVTSCGPPNKSRRQRRRRSPPWRLGYVVAIDVKKTSRVETINLSLVAEAAEIVDVKRDQIGMGQSHGLYELAILSEKTVCHLGWSLLLSSKSEHNRRSK